MVLEGGAFSYERGTPEGPSLLGNRLQVLCSLPHGEVQSILRKSTCSTQLTSGQFRKTRWLQLPLKLDGNETLLAHRTERGFL